MSDRVLLVDDDENLLSALRRQLHKEFDLATVISGELAVKAVIDAAAEARPFAVVVADMRMSGMNGIETLEQIRKIAPDTVRMMLTGNADQETAISAINRGNIFRFFCKPCPTNDLMNGIKDGVAQYRLVAGEADLLRKIQLTSRALKTLSEANLALLRAQDMDGLLTEICRAAVEAGGYRMAWVGRVQNDAEQSIVPLASFGDGVQTYLETTRFSQGDGADPVGLAVKLGQPQILQNIWADAVPASWRQAARDHNFSSVIALPISGPDAPFGVLAIYSGGTEGFITEEVKLLEELAEDMAYGIASQGLRHERDQSLKESQLYLSQLQNNLEETIKAFASTIEIRDPYTAGHQRRVATLARAIGQELGLTDEQIEGLYFAALIHDLGKIKVPAEILSNPGHLSEVEFMLIKVHPQAGYDILKGIHFPWPIAKIVQQHHEKLDGSGYPHGLKGDDILLESRILTVADIVESMASHRPYRPSLGVEMALNEIAQGRGTHFDPVVVDAAFRLFREQGYMIEF